MFLFATTAAAFISAFVMLCAIVYEKITGNDVETLVELSYACMIVFCIISIIGALYNLAG